MEHQFTEYLEYYIILVKETGTTINMKSIPQLPLKSDFSELRKLDTVHHGIADYYSNFSNGYILEWWVDKEKSVAGKLQLLEVKYLVATDPKDIGIYHEGDDEELRYFRPLDYPSPETSVGFIIKPDIIYKSLYYLTSDYEFYNLDLDFHGYTQMALEARVFNYWHVILLHHMGKMEIGAFETEKFKTEMPKIFTDWTWEKFIAKFESLRLSKRV